MNTRRFSLINSVITAFALLILGGCSQLAPAHQAAIAADSSHDPDPEVINLNKILGLSQIIPELNEYRAVLVGESHTYYHHHLAQLEVIKRLYAQNPKLVIGMEMFQRPFQAVLDQFIAGDIDENTMLEKTEYYRRWKFDYRLYAPILRFAREHQIPVIALNIDKDITSKVSKSGLESLTEHEKQQIPQELDRDVAGYEKRIKSVFDQHPGAKKKDFEKFIDVQTLWDEGMAESSANYLNIQPDAAMVILAGAGHIAYRTGIPVRLERRLKSQVATMLNSDNIKLEPGIADYVMFPANQELPKSGLMGVFLDEKNNQVKAVGFSDHSSGKKAGIKKGDIFSRINERAIAGIPDIRIAMWDKKPGDQIRVEVERKGNPVALEVTLK